MFFSGAMEEEALTEDEAVLEYILGFLVIMIIICYFRLDWLILIAWMFLSLFVVSFSQLKSKSDQNLFVSINAVFCLFL